MGNNTENTIMSPCESSVFFLISYTSALLILIAVAELEEFKGQVTVGMGMRESLLSGNRW